MWSNEKLITGKSFPGRIKLTRVLSEANAEKKGKDKKQEREEEGEGGGGEGERNEEVFETDVGKMNSEHNEILRKLKVKKEDNQEPSSSSSSQTPPYSNSNSNSNLESNIVQNETKKSGRSFDSARISKFQKELSENPINLDALRDLSWNGIPSQMRPTVWKLLLGYASLNKERRDSVLLRKRKEYHDFIDLYFDIANEERTDEELHTLRQISVDVPRTVSDVKFFHHSKIQNSLERILYIWAVRHPASGYVQGINDLVTPFLTVFLSEHLGDDMAQWHVATLDDEKILQVEADCYWCISKLLDNVQDHYTFAQPGIQRLVFKLKELVKRIDEPVSRQMEEQGLEFLQFAFRWFNCLLIREIPFPLVPRLWDTYLAEGNSFSEFLVYICASFLLTWSAELKKLDFQEMVMFLQHVPTSRWTESELEMIISRAFMWRVMFDRSPKHLNA